VCPTGIDIRNGHQLECAGCTACIDACDEVMTRLERPKGLIRYDSLRAVETGQRRFWRPRVYFYGFMGVLGLVVATVVIAANDPFAADFLRAGGSPFSIVDGVVENRVRVHVVNKQGKPALYRIGRSAEHPDDIRFVTLPQPEIRLEPFADHDLPVLIKIPVAEWRRGIVLHLQVTSSVGDVVMPVEVKVLGPNRIAGVKGATP
jgi:polyferredoxin